MNTLLRHPLSAAGLRIGILSTFPPTSCGIATFAAALARGMEQQGASVVGVHTGTEVERRSPVEIELGAADRASVDAAAAVLDSCDATIVQHEYGIYPGVDGSAVLDVVHALTTTVIVVAHTVLSNPTPNQRRILGELCAAADLVVVMTEVAQRRLVEQYGVEPDRVEVIPHGAAVGDSTAGADVGSPIHSPRILTWGLLGPGKGIEWAIDAFAQLQTLGSLPHYVVAGATHPNVKAHDGEAYRESLIRRARALGVGDRVIFDDTYRTVDELSKLVATADVVVLPYDSAEQVTSGVLVDAVAAGRPVVSTAFPHAIELLATGAGLVVPQRDAPALARAVEAVLDDHQLARAMAAEARRLAPSLSWPAVAGAYLDSILRVRQLQSTLAS